MKLLLTLFLIYNIYIINIINIDHIYKNKVNFILHKKGKEHLIQQYNNYSY